MMMIMMMMMTAWQIWRRKTLETIEKMAFSDALPLEAACHTCCSRLLSRSRLRVPIMHQYIQFQHIREMHDWVIDNSSNSRRSFLGDSFSAYLSVWSGANLDQFFRDACYCVSIRRAPKSTAVESRSQIREFVTRCENQKRDVRNDRVIFFRINLSYILDPRG